MLLRDYGWVGDAPLRVPWILLEATGDRRAAKMLCIPPSPLRRGCALQPSSGLRASSFLEEGA